ncbi:hypothetical protein SAMN04489761_2868 [Tenacibaculum sp. MAR_2009_124]|uniref:hypothetical protein n=1 Tax=Tenacibaculum sp. MAR_2009_124 TaxID=1250059 RepID=UPI0008948FE6|nr:hypothetical protein [Tenacibaculum sp. MAR_2009_124]SEC39282.1 hypothetical protein SAMN04489761_2868 [Tenacibaculum sp. MAR_2009_124]
MNKYLLIFFLSMSSIAGFSQKTSVEKSIFGVQTGFLGIWVHNESKLNDSFVLRTELGLDGGIWGGSYYERTGFLLTPVVTLEPRWYYNLDRRQEKARRIDGNSGNFLSIKTSYNPSWFTISNYDNVVVLDGISIIPTWGIRRNIGKYINYEAGIGMGYGYVFKNRNYSLNGSGGLALNLHLRIGFKL